MTEHQPEHQPERALDAADPDDLPEQMLVRRDKRARLLAEGRPPYPVSVARTHSLGDVRARYADLATDRASGDVVSVAGRVVFVRIGGKLCFATIQEGDGTRLQVMISLDQVGADSLAAFKSDADLGDFLAVTGEVISSRRGELSVLAREWSVASKALRPLPVLHKELSEESRVRQRYVDLIVRDSARANARRRPAMVRGIRNFFDERGYIEVETPMLQVLHGGANARPFRTHMNAFDMELFLRIAPELFLKRALVGGIERVFEINRNFRNEGADSTHSPEFTMIEAYEAFGDYNTMAQLTQDLVQAAAVAATGSTLVELADGTEYDLGGTWANITMFGSLSAALGTAVGPETPMEHLVQFAEKHEVPVLPHYGPGKLAEELFEALVVPSLYEPTFVRDYPAETSPLTRAHRDTPGLAEKWDLYIRSFELGTGYSELTDPVLQRERFVSQARAIAAGDVEGMVLDEDFLRAMEYGMPPAGGIGVGVDRLLMAITGLGVRETILFPLVKPE